MEGSNQHDAHVAKVGTAITKRSHPGGFVLSETFPDLCLMTRSDASSQQKSSDSFRHEIPWTRNDDHVPIVLERVYEMRLERRNIAASMKSNEGGLIKANPAT
jgi:hypothetical protein